MTPEQRQRAGRAVAARIGEMRRTVPEIAKAAGVAPNTLRALINGTRWPMATSRARINKALGWETGEISRRALGGDPRLRDVSTVDLARELCRRVELWEAERTKVAGSRNLHPNA